MSKRASPPAEHSAQRLLALADACVLCGLCLPHCPTYQLDGRESESPRGRVVLAQMLARDPAQFESSAIEALEHCLGCGRCEQVCPAKVQFGEVMRLSHQLLPKRRKRLRVHALLWVSRHPHWIDRLLPALRAARGLLPRQSRRALADAGAALTTAGVDAHASYQSAGASAAAQSGGAPNPQSINSSAPLRIGLLTGCVARHLESGVHHAAAQLLRACGHTVLVPHEQVCCGALDQHADRGARSPRMAAINQRLWGRLQPDLLVTTASGCQGAYTTALSGFAPVSDVLSLLANDIRFATLALRRIDRRVALHLPCTQRGFAGSAEACRSLLARVPGLDLVELADTGCCGAAGAHMLQFPQRADALRQPLLNAVIASSATTLMSANIGCRLHLAGAAELAGVAIRHPLELLAEVLP